MKTLRYIMLVAMMVTSLSLNAEDFVEYMLDDNIWLY